MVALIQAALVAALCSVGPQAHDGWGVLSFREGKPVLLSTSHLPKDLRLRAYRVGAWKTPVDVVVGDGARNEKSALYDQDGYRSNWEHGITSSSPLAPDALWICLPVDLTAVGRDQYHATLERGATRVGEVEVAPQGEGIDFTLRLGKHSEKVYYYLGYGLE